MASARGMTLGAEEEMHVVDLGSGELSARAPELLAALPGHEYGAELQQSTIETNTPVVDTLDDLAGQLRRLRAQAIDVAGGRGLAIAAVGTVPLDGKAELTVTPTGRFTRMHEDYRLLVEEQLICGTQVHVGVDDRDIAVAVSQRVTNWLPVLLALSASSPFWHGVDTGYASIRTMIWQRWPTAGATGPIDSAEQYDLLVSDLIASGVIADAKMAYFDVRPSAHVPTVELRVCDACPLVDDAVLIASLFRGLVASEVRAVRAGLPPPRPFAGPVHRAAMWRAARSGLAGELIAGIVTPQGAGQRPRPAADVVRALLEYVRPELEHTGDWALTVALADAAIRRGTSAYRQRSRYRQRGRLADVIELVVQETKAVGDGDGLAPGTRIRLEAPVTAYDGFPDESPGPQIMTAIAEHGPQFLLHRLAERDRVAESLGMTFGVDGRRQPFPVDLVPRVVPSDEWDRLRPGLRQRARALEAFLRDVYGAGEIVRDGVVPEAVVHGSPGWMAAGRRIPAGVMRAPVIGFDLVRDRDGRWRVLEDNVRVPSGVGYALAAREILDKVMPDLPRPAELRDPNDAPVQLRRTLQAMAGGPDSVVALLSDGPTNSAWFEHTMLSERAGLLLVQPREVRVQDGRVVARHLGEDVALDMLYLRLSVEIDELRAAHDAELGLRIMDVAAGGRVVLANAPGNGVADDKSIYPFVPSFIEYYLRETPLLSDVTTYRCTIERDRHTVLERLENLVTKPVDGYGGAGVLLGPYATADELAVRRGEIETAPDRWVAQEMVRLSTAPVVDGDRLAPRHVDLRAFVYSRGLGLDDVRVADIALTRVAPSGSMVVNSSRGGGAKDTWILR